MGFKIVVNLFFQKARLFVIDTQTVHVLNILEVVDDAGDEIDVLNVKMNMNDDFLVAMVVSTFDNDKNKTYATTLFGTDLTTAKNLLKQNCSNIKNI